MKEIRIKNDSELSYEVIGSIIDSPKLVLQHLNEAIYYQDSNGAEYAFILNVYSDKNIETWEFKGVRS